MRISTNQIYDTAALNIQRNQSGLYKLQNQMSTGRRVLTPEDDPVAAAAALSLSQAQAVNAQHIANQASATDQLRIVDSQLSALTSALQNVRDLVLQANSGGLASTDRASIAAEIEARLSETLGIANSQNAVGDYLFSGYQGATRPFAIDAAQAPVPPATSSPVAYYGDDGERLLQVGASRQIAVNVAGADVFMSAKAGNGTFITASASGNQGSATVDAGSLLDPQKWQAAVNDPAAGAPLEIRFTIAAGVTTYGIYDPVSGATSGPLPFTPGAAIPLVSSAGVDFGAQVVVQGQPASGDSFTVEPSANQSIFQTLQNLVATVRSASGQGSAANTAYAAGLAAGLTDLDQSLQNISRVQATVGTRLRELDSLASTATDLEIQYEDSWSKLVGLDYVKAISDFAMQQTYLEAAQKSFAQISGSSLFNYL